MDWFGILRGRAQAARRSTGPGDQRSRYRFGRAAARLALLAAGLLTASLVVAPGPALATGGVNVSGNTLTVTAEPGHANNIRLGLVNTTVSITDTGDFVLAGNGCIQLNRNIVECDVSGVTRITINTGDLDDVVDSQVLFDTTVNGGTGNDTITTSGRADKLSGNAGNDTLNGGAGDDTLNGGTDADVLNGGPGRDELDGGTGPDALNGGADIDEADYQNRSVGVTVNLDGIALDGEPGEGDNVAVDVEDVLGGEGNDTLTGSDLANVQNRLVGGEGHDVLTGLAGQDLLVGNAGNDTLSGGDGPDTMFPGSGNDTMSGGAGDDEVSYSERTTRVVITLDGLPGDGEVAIGENDNVGADMEDVTTGSGDDKIVGNGAGNVLIGGAGPDFLDGAGGADFLGGNGGVDNLNGGDGDDDLRGGPDGDTLNGGRHDDRLFGEDGDDTLSGGILGAGNDGADRMDGGFGNDTVDYSDHGGIAVLATLDGIDNDGAIGANERDNLEFGIENITGGSGGDVLIGDGGPNRLLGGKFTSDLGDQLDGRGGDDLILGGFGNDTLTCGAGFDTVDGGAGIDTLPPFHGCEPPHTNIP